MKAYPLILTASEVRAVLDGSKTQHRVRVRFTRPSPWQIMDEGDDGKPWPFFQDEFGDYHPMHCPFGVPGERLWVREGIKRCQHIDGPWHTLPDDRIDAAYYVADGEITDLDFWPWSRSFLPLCPYGLSRITLAVDSVRVQRVQDISEEDARAEGARFHDGHGVGHSGWRIDDRDVHPDAYSAYGRLWIEKYGRASWDANPWVFATTFKRVNEWHDTEQRQKTCCA